MATVNQIEMGAVQYIDAELAPKIPTNIPNGQIKKIAAISGTVYAIRRGLQTIGDNPTLTAIGAVNADGDIDVNGLAAVVREQIPDAGFKLTVPILGDLTFYAEDVDKLLQYIEEA